MIYSIPPNPKLSTPRTFFLNAFTLFTLFSLITNNTPDTATTANNNPDKHPHHNRPLHPLHHDNWVATAVFGSDGTRVITISWDGVAKIWDTQIERALVASQQQEEKNLGPVEGHEVEDALVAFGLLGLQGLARRVGKDLTTLRQWYHDGCPACPMPYPDVRAVGLETGREEPDWFTDGQIRDWLAQVNSGKPLASGSKLDRTQPTNTPYGQKENKGVMGKIYDRLRQDFDTTLTVMSAGEASLKDLAEDFPRVLRRSTERARVRGGGMRHKRDP